MIRVMAASAAALVCGCEAQEGRIAGQGERPVVAQTAPAQQLDIAFVDSDGAAFSEADKDYIRKVIAQSAQAVRRLLPDMPRNVMIDIEMVDRDLAVVGGGTGMAGAPGEVTFWVSSAYPGGVAAAADNGVRYTAFHEFHHLSRGWTVQGNSFRRGIDIAIINEGLADVFAETYSGRRSNSLDYPQEVRAWAAEILALPEDADYHHWMNEHPDGRMAIGYRTGRYVIHEAMQKSGKSILELGDVPVGEIWRLAGFDYDRPSALQSGAPE